MAGGCVFNIQRYSVRDGPGIRTTVFLKGCPLSCAWCHNPEGISPRRQLVLVETRCVRCGRCVDACPHAPTESAPGLGTDLAGCDLCGACVDACSAGAREIAGREMSVAAVLAEVRRDRMFYEESGGGVTFSGGEPLMQAAFLLALLAACREEGLHTAVDTCGLCQTEDLLAASSLTDLFLYDLKLMDDEAHRAFTGVSNGRILENLRALGAVHRNIWVRVPLIAGINDDEGLLESVARFAASVPGVRQVNLLPYHATGVAKAHRAGHAPGMGALATPEGPVLARALAVFAAAGVTAKAGG